jgi:hypothetical protein
MGDLRTKNPFGRNHGVHKDQKKLVDHRNLRHSDRMECSDYEGVWTKEEDYYLKGEAR